MTTCFPPVLRLFAILGVATGMVAAVDEPAAPVSLTIVGRTVLVPPPAGYVRCDGISPKWDRTIENMLPADNRLLANFGAPADEAALREGVAPPFARSFNVQILRSNEDLLVTDRVFSEVREASRKELEATRKQIQAKVNEALEAGSRHASEDLGVDLQLTVGEMAMLGTFEDSEVSYGFTMALTMKGQAPGGGDKQLRQVVAAMLVPANGRLLLLYSNMEFRDNADRLEAERSVLAWRDAIVAANPKPAGAAKQSLFDSIRGIGSSTLIGAVGGVIIALLILLYRRFKK